MDKEGCKIKKRIMERSKQYYKNNPEVCAKHNFFCRCIAFLKYEKRVWPPLKREEIRDFLTTTKYPVGALRIKRELAR